MKKGIIAFALMFMVFAGLFITLPVMAIPPEEQKVPVVVKFTQVGKSEIVAYNTTPSGVNHRELIVNYKVELFIGDSTTALIGSAIVHRSATWLPAKEDGQNGILNDEYSMSFPTVDGGFVGNGHLQFTDYISHYDNIGRTHGVFHGTGSFEGQMLNVAKERGPPSFMWDGFLLKG